MLEAILIQITTLLLIILVSVICSLLYFRHIRLERPPIGVFNGWDITILFAFVLLLPLIYIHLPPVLLVALLFITFVSALHIGLRPLLPGRFLWPVILLLPAITILFTKTFFNTPLIEQIHWIFMDCMVLIAVVGVSNLYVQGGMRVQHFAWFALGIAFYDAFFDLIIPVTQHLAEIFINSPLYPAFGFTFGSYSTSIGLGDLLLYSLFAVVAYKGFGKRGVIVAFFIIFVFGFFCPALSPLLIKSFFRAHDVLIPAQIFFGPAAFISYFWLSRHTSERRMAEWHRFQEVTGYKLIQVRVRNRVLSSQSLSKSSL